MRKVDYLNRAMLPLAEKIAMLNHQYLQSLFKLDPMLGHVLWQDHRTREQFLTQSTSPPHGHCVGHRNSVVGSLLH